MKGPALKLAFVVATKDRPADLRRMLQSLTDQTRRPDEVVIVDASQPSVESVVASFSDFPIRYIRHEIPSAAGQRNAGISAVDAQMDLIGFLDDDVVLGNQAIEKIVDFWISAPSDLGGCAFNMMNTPITAAPRLKGSRLVRWLGLYSDRRGAVTPSGWQTMIGTVTQTLWVDWLPSGAVVWRREILNRHRFDEFFEGYSYLEDLDFSFGVRHDWRLAVVADAPYWHYPSPRGRIRPVEFGLIEVRNRLYIVRKHGLSLPRCVLGIGVRLLMTVGSGIRHRDRAILQRAWGNCRGLARCLWGARRGCAPVRQERSNG